MQRTIKLSDFVIPLFFLLPFAVRSADASAKLSPDAQKATAAGQPVQVIVQWNVPTGTATRTLIQALGGSVVQEFQVIHAGTYLIPANTLSQLENDAEVKYVSLDRPIKSKLDYSAAAVNASAAINAGWNGAGVGVAIIDSGINADVNLSNIAYTQDFTGAKGSHYGADDYGHGQHVAGIVASTSASTQGTKYTRNFTGMAPAASLIDLRVLDATGAGTDTNVIAAIETAIQWKKTYNIGVINLSLGRPVEESYTLDPLCQAAEAAWKAGIVVVVAAGNDGRDNSQGTSGYGTINAPGNDPYVITVGAMKTEGTYSRTDDLMASYSSKGPTMIDHIVKPDLVAPGNRVVSLLAEKSALLAQNPANDVLVSYYEDTSAGQGKKVSQEFFLLSGTSMAAPVVSGAAADLLQLNPALTPDQIKALLMQTAYKTFPSSSSVTDPVSGITYTSYYDAFTVGAGYLDLDAAIAAVGQAPAAGVSAQSPAAAYNPASGAITVSPASKSVLPQKAIWGKSIVLPASVVTAESQLFGSSSIWAAAGTTSESTTVAVTGEP
jgi:serine protease AprX